MANASGGGSAADAYVFGDCTYYVATRFPQIYPYMGNAIDWINSAKKQGYGILSQPTPGTIVVYGSSYSPYGHVAVVESVNGDGTFNVSEMNYNGWDVVDRRKSTMAGVQGFIVPPGSTISTLSAQQNASKDQQQWTMPVQLPSLIPGQDGPIIYLDGLAGWAAMVAGGMLMLAGLTVLVAYAMSQSKIGQTAARGLAVIPNPAAKVASAAASASEKKTESVAETPEQAESAHTARMARAKSRVSSETQHEVDEAKAGRGKRLSPRAKQELRVVQGNAA